ncbi:MULTISPECIES: hypothetical protein [unclassified Mesorhizobium]|uniref:hypothetical protein n=1 Tax=unclassified Mesorhizobium TaxID=325217 RepID=UPI000FE82A75|nr:MULTISPECIES: hypothetical protein [unclassified Mesorhizobium]RWF70268.1 MAG: hypothetical protein EOQ34_19235 [Mesorhizobium sp.]RWH43937.1 MAG: hypothetical protein EOQ78_11675 [Mesorhizobium sp.]TIO81509.1 MAG: hypothetical protein E5Y00_10210 [Mesorhizobium sp.]TIP28589.1 MAG: hypothetical protein E5X90_13185 [Mesorhizobium sp.]TIS70778.1 MAG: hypothetical protein E5X11_03475 [Mesorhizobium sp.]
MSLIHVSTILEILKRGIADMLTPDKKYRPRSSIGSSDLTIGDLLHTLADYQDKPLVFRYDAAGR